MHTLPSTYLQKVPEQPEDADNQKNVTRMIQPPLDKTTTVNIPVTITAPPGETTVIPSECFVPLPLVIILFQSHRSIGVGLHCFADRPHIQTQAEQLVAHPKPCRHGMEKSQELRLCVLCHCQPHGT